MNINIVLGEILPVKGIYDKLKNKLIKPYHTTFINSTLSVNIPYRLKKNRLKVWSAEILVG